jgi:hypothetical protein
MKKYSTSKLLVALVIVSLLSLPFCLAKGKPDKPGKPGPPPEPTPEPQKLELSRDLNFVIGFYQDTNMMLVKQDSDGEFVGPELIETDYGSSRIQIADVDGVEDTDGAKWAEIVVARGCTIGKGKNKEYGFFINLFKNGETELYNSNYYDATQYLIDTSASRLKILAANLDDDLEDEIVMMTDHKIGIYDFDATYDYGMKLVKTIDLADLPYSELQLKWRDFAIGDVLGADSPQIVSAGSYRDDDRKDHEYLFVFDPDLLTSPLSYDLFPTTDDFSIANVRIGNHDGDEQNEIWISGWRNHFELAPFQYDNLVYSWTIEENNQLVPFADIIDADGPDYSSSLGPEITIGDFYPGESYPGDELIIRRQGNDPPSTYIEIYNDLEPVDTIYYENLRAYGLEVSGGYIFVSGFIPYEMGHFLEIFQIQDGVLDPNPVFSFQDLDGAELSGPAVGLGVVN